MDGFLHTQITSLIAIILTTWMSFKVGSMRGKHSVKAPDCHGPDEFNNIFRAHQNMIERLVIFLPALWIFANVVNDMYAGIIGSIWLIGRVLYFYSYAKDPSKRTAGFMIDFFSVAVMIIWALVMLLLKLV